MSDSIEKQNVITEKIIGCAIEVHKTLGPGLLESIYEKALCYELEQKGLRFKTQVMIPIVYKGSSLGEHRIDLIVEDSIIVELKAVDKVMPVYEAQLLSYLRLTNMKLGLLINFNVEELKRGVKRMIL